MDTLYDYNECVDIEEARCQRRADCKKDGVLHKDFKDFDKATCISFAKENCRTRKLGQDPVATDSDPDPLESCLLAVGAVECSDLDPRRDETELLPACWFINKLAEEEEPNAGADAG